MEIAEVRRSGLTPRAAGLRLPRFSGVEGLLVIGFVIILCGVLVLGGWIERHVMEDSLRTTATTIALLLDDLVAAQLQPLDSKSALSSDSIAALDRAFTQMATRVNVVGLKVWSADRRILYSDTSSLIGRPAMRHRAHIEQAWGGALAWRVSGLVGAEHAALRSSWDRLLEVFTPIHVGGDGDVVAVAEFYYPLDGLGVTIGESRRKMWFVVIAVALPLYVLLAIAVRRTAKTVWRQESELNDRVATLSAVIEDNRVLQDNIRAAAANGIAVNEQIRSRFSTELHDGPVQHVSYALLRLDGLRQCHEECCGSGRDCRCVRELEGIRSALQTGLAELRHLSSGFAGVDVSDLHVGKVVNTAVGQHIRRTRTDVDLNVSDLPETVPLSVKIAIYRFIQESLNNAFRHAEGEGQRVGVFGNGDTVVVEVSDNGPGFSPQEAMRRGNCLGLRGLKDRISVLGGELDIASRPGFGARLTARLPLNTAAEAHGS